MGRDTWSFQGPAGTPDGWLMLDGAMAGGSAGMIRDGYDLIQLHGGHARPSSKRVER